MFAKVIIPVGILLIAVSLCFGQLDSTVCLDTLWETYFDSLIAVDTSISIDSILDTIYAEGNCDSITIYGTLVIMPLIPVELVTIEKLDTCLLEMSWAAMFEGRFPDTVIDVCEMDIRYFSGSGAKAAGIYMQALPNPFNTSVDIQVLVSNYDLRFTKLRLSIYDISGKLVYSEFVTRNSSLGWDASAHPSGKYLFVLRVGERVYTTTVVKIK
jgi:hypothetical protein